MIASRWVHDPAVAEGWRRAAFKLGLRAVDRVDRMRGAVTGRG